MTEPKPNLDGLYDDGTCGFGDNIPDVGVVKWDNPETGYITMNGEPLSTKQLHELIVSQSMTIDTALTRNGELVDALKQLHEIFKNGDFTTKHINDIINKALG
jgi:hypothetical protein